VPSLAMPLECISSCTSVMVVFVELVKAPFLPQFDDKALKFGGWWEIKPLNNNGEANFGSSFALRGVLGLLVLVPQ
jgi:hypothetical protein